MTRTQTTADRDDLSTDVARLRFPRHTPVDSVGRSAHSPAPAGGDESPSPPASRTTAGQLVVR